MLERIDRCVDALAEKAGSAAPAAEAPAFAAKALEDFAAAVNDDLNTPKAFAALFELVRESNFALAGLEPAQAAAVLEVFRKMDSVLGVVFFGKAAKVEVPAEIQALLDERAAARAAKNWAESDRLRDAIAAAGWIVKDSKQGQSVTKK